MIMMAKLHFEKEKYNIFPSLISSIKKAPGLKLRDLVGLKPKRTKLV